MSSVLYFDCFSGAAGDMILAALLDAGLPIEELRRALGTLGVGHELVAERVMRAGIAATHVSVRDTSDGHHTHDHGHDHHHHGHDHHDHHHAHHHDHAHIHHEHRTLAEIARLIEGSGLSGAGKARAIALFQRIGEAEASIHNMPIENVHLHEVAAVDSIIDIIGAVFALEWFGADEIIASPLNVGGGSVRISHGTFPVPAPATLKLLAGAPVYSTGIQAELVTPTGALIVTDYAKSFGPMPAMAVRRIGYGAGTKDLGSVPNVLRVVVGERTTSEARRVDASATLQMDCEIDDMNPQLFGPLGERLVAAGALDVFLTPVQMKKGRPGTLLTVLLPSEHRAAITTVIFRETTTLGVRLHQIERETLEREWREVIVPGGVVRMKVASRGGEIMNAAPEFDDCLRVAGNTGQPVKVVQAAAMRAWLELNSK
jgi:pyridinium-3,5-bisthiocarboxylic acid mononucleotide nickel chelatase